MSREIISIQINEYSKIVLIKYIKYKLIKLNEISIFERILICCYNSIIKFLIKNFLIKNFLILKLY